MRYSHPWLPSRYDVPRSMLEILLADEPELVMGINTDIGIYSYYDQGIPIGARPICLIAEFTRNCICVGGAAGGRMRLFGPNRASLLVLPTGRLAGFWPPA